MTKTATHWAIAFVGFGLAWSLAAAEPTVEVRASYPTAGSSYVDITVTVGDLPLPQTWVVPRAIPMGYDEQPYDRFGDGLAAFDSSGAALSVERQEGPRWRIDGQGGLRRLSYRVDVATMEAEIRQASDASKVRPGYVGLLGYSVFGTLEGHEDDPISLVVDAPDDWPVFSTLAPAQPPPSGRLEARAADFYALADSQIALGPDLVVSRIDGPVPLFVALYAELPVSPRRIGAVAAEALSAVAAYFGPAPFERYSVLMEVLRPKSADHEYGFSMEHLDSGTFFFDAEMALSDESPETAEDRHRYNFAHHMAHSWLPKRCHAEGYYPFSWELTPVLDSIWFSEGFAQYAAAAALADAAGEPAMRDRIVGRRFQASLDGTPAFLRRLSTVELSRIASTRYSSDFRTGRESFARGGMMAAEMDDAIRAASGGERDLRHALRALCSWAPGQRRGFALADLPRLLSEGAGVDLTPICDRWLAPRQQ